MGHQEIFCYTRTESTPDDRRVSNYTLGKLVAHAMNMMTGFSIMPLQIASVTGFLFTFFGLGVLLYVTGRYLVQDSPVPGFLFSPR